MFQRQGMILEWSVEIGLRGIACVTRLGKEAEIGEPQASHQGNVPDLGRTISSDQGVGVQRQQRQGQKATTNEEEKYPGFSH